MYHKEDKQSALLAWSGWAINATFISQRTLVSNNARDVNKR